MAVKTALIHDVKLDALEELIEELAGQQLLLAYEFNADLERLKGRFPNLSYIGQGVGEKQTTEIVDAWNRGDIGLLACHPASAAHGLNLQYSSCAHLAWFSPTWDLELYQQFIRRIRRQGNDAQRIVNHLLCVRDTIDELKLEALRDKDVTQERLLRSLNSELTGEKEMAEVAKLSRQADSADAPRIMPKGWARPAVVTSALQPPQNEAAVVTPALHNIEEQRERIQETLRGAGGADEDPTPAEKARAAFSPSIRAQLEGTATTVHPDDVGKPAAATTTPFMPPTETPTTAPPTTADVPKATRQRRVPAASAGATAGDLLDQGFRVEILKLAMGYAALVHDCDVLKVANDMLAFVTAA